MVDTVSKYKRSIMMKNIKSKNTRPEIIIRSFLHKCGFRFRLHQKHLPGKPDIVMPKYNSALQIRGCFWHPHVNCKLSNLPKTNTKFWKDKLSGNVIRDKKNDKLLKQLGWKLIVIRECQIRNKNKIEKTFGILKKKIMKNFNERVA